MNILSANQEERILSAVRTEKFQTNRWNVPPWCGMWFLLVVTLFLAVSTVAAWTFLADPWGTWLFKYSLGWMLLGLCGTAVNYAEWQHYKTRFLLRKLLDQSAPHPSCPNS
jgi:hypothetical protein